MALLSGGANSALNNNPYMAKRGILFDLLSKGKFIPRHTMDVFNKVLNTAGCANSFSSELSVWTKERDLKAHIEWMEKRNSEIRQELISLSKTEEK